MKGSLLARVPKAGLTYVALVCGAGAVLGTIRVWALVPRLGAGGVALALLVALVLGLVVVVQHQSLEESIASRDPISGGVYLAMLVVFAAMPLILTRVEGGDGVLNVITDR